MVRRAWWMPNPETILEDLLRAASNTRRRTDPQSLEHIEKVKATKRAKREARLAEKMNARVPRPRPASCQLQMLRGMNPGAWYGAKELGRSVGLDHDQSNSAAWALRQKRWVTRQANPRWDPKPIDPWEIAAGAVREPQWLYRLTAEGEARQLSL